MFQSIRLQNFRTHVDTELELGPITLLIGGNNAGKTNLLAGIGHFSRLVARGDAVCSDEFLPHRHRLAPDDAPMGFACSWADVSGEVRYEAELYPSWVLDGIGCRERIDITADGETAPRRVQDGWEGDEQSGFYLRADLQAQGLTHNETQLCMRFFDDLCACHTFDLQPDFLKGNVGNDATSPTYGTPSFAHQLGPQGGNLQRLLAYVKENDEAAFNRLLARLQRFEPSFRNISYGTELGEPQWLFDLGEESSRLEEFPPQAVSDGLLRAAAISLLSCMSTPPAMMLIEEIENGVNQRNMGEFLAWLRQAAGLPDAADRGHATQFILTSHSPSVVREFAEHLEHVYHFRLHKRGYQSVVSSLSSSLKVLIDLGTVKGEVEKRDGKDIVRITPEQLTELWFNGVIGGA